MKICTRFKIFNRPKRLKPVSTRDIGHYWTAQCQTEWEMWSPESGTGISQAIHGEKKKTSSTQGRQPPQLEEKSWTQKGRAVGSNNRDKRKKTFGSAELLPHCFPLMDLESLVPTPAARQLSPCPEAGTQAQHPPPNLPELLHDTRAPTAENSRAPSLHTACRDFFVSFHDDSVKSTFSQLIYGKNIFITKTGIDQT